MTPSVLYTSADVRQAIIELFTSAKGRRVAVAAFVGDGRRSYLPNPEGLELICWPKPGGTNPKELRKLLQSKVKIMFADSLHMKVYWTEDRGTVITSANLSTNALGSGDLKEAGVLLPPGAVDIDRLLAPLKMRAVTESELRKLDRLHNLYASRNRIVTQREEFSFADWFHQPFRPLWRLTISEENANDEISLISIEQITTEYGISEPELICKNSVADFKKGDWVLNVKLTNRQPVVWMWSFVDLVVAVPRSDKRAYDREYPYETIQLWPLKQYPSPPFTLEKQFRAAIAKAILEYGIEEITSAESTKPPTTLVNAIYAYYTQTLKKAEP